MNVLNVIYMSGIDNIIIDNRKSGVNHKIIKTLFKSSFYTNQ
jgi:hypothetical protein